MLHFLLQKLRKLQLLHITLNHQEHIGLGIMKYLSFLKESNFYTALAVAQWLRCCATNRKVAGSIPAGVSGIFH